MGQLENGAWVSGLGFAGGDGRFARTESRFRNWITPDGAPGPSGRGGFRAESGRYHLYVSLACPWAHRTLIFRALKGLAPHVSVDLVHPLMLDDGWTFATDFPRTTGDRVLGTAFLREVYLTHPGFNQISPIIHRWHDTDCPVALNTQIVVFKDQ